MRWAAARWRAALQASAPSFGYRETWNALQVDIKQHCVEIFVFERIPRCADRRDWTYGPNTRFAKGCYDVEPHKRLILNN